MSHHPEKRQMLFEWGVALLLFLFFVMLQHQIWFTRDSVAGNAALQAQIRLLRSRVTEDRFRDDLLHAEVRNLERGTRALEAAARYDLGYIHPGETFYQVITVTPNPRATNRTHAASAALRPLARRGGHRSD